jgi:paraquat-inducible protein B
MKIRKISSIWLIPLLILLLVLTVMYKNYNSQGVLINITLPSASGIVINKTKLKYKNVVIGTVEKLVITQNLQSVVASIRVDAAMSKYMTDKAKFWLVKAKVSLTELSGLETLLTGVYIDSFLYQTGKQRLDFIALKQQPLQFTRKKGLLLKLISDEFVNLEVGALVYLADKPIGVVQRVDLSEDLTKTKVYIFIKEKFSKYVNNSTMFWRMSVLNASLKNNEFKVEMAPIKSLLVGGIRLKTMNKNAKAIKNNKFTLFSSKEKALDFYKKQDFSQIFKFVLFFKDIHGLEVGANVEYLGVKVGKVVSIELYKYPDGRMKAPVVIVIYPETIKATMNYPHKKEIIKAIEKHGLRAKLKMSSLITGDLYIVLDEGEQKEIKAVKVKIDPIYKYPIFVTKDSGLLNNINKLLEVANKSLIDIEKTSKSMHKLIDSIYEDPNQLIWGK